MIMPMQTPKSPKETLKAMRVLWAALLGGQVIFAGVVAFTSVSSGPLMTDLGFIQTLFYISLGLLVAGAFVGHVGRMQCYKRHWENSVVKPEGYAAGNLIFWACCEGTSLFSLMVALLAGSFFPYAAAAAVAMSLMISTWPNGNPMKPAEPELLYRK